MFVTSELEAAPGNDYVKRVKCVLPKAIATRKSVYINPSQRFSAFPPFQILKFSSPPLIMAIKKDA